MFSATFSFSLISFLFSLTAFPLSSPLFLRAPPFLVPCHRIFLSVSATLVTAKAAAEWNLKRAFYFCNVRPFSAILLRSALDWCFLLISLFSSLNFSPCYSVNSAGEAERPLLVTVQHEKRDHCFKWLEKGYSRSVADVVHTTHVVASITAPHESHMNESMSKTKKMIRCARGTNSFLFSHKVAQIMYRTNLFYA